MPFSVKAYYAHRPLTVIAETAKEAFAKAVEWHVVERFTNVSISDGVKSYSIEGFASTMTLQGRDSILDQSIAGSDLGVNLTRPNMHTPQLC